MVLRGEVGTAYITAGINIQGFISLETSTRWLHFEQPSCDSDKFFVRTNGKLLTGLAIYIRNLVQFHNKPFRPLCLGSSGPEVGRYLV